MIGLGVLASRRGGISPLGLIYEIKIIQVKAYGPQRTPRLNMAVVYAKSRYAESASAGYFISSDSTLKNKLYRRICMRIDQYHRLRISDHDDFDALT